jgi:hypothetical protein
MNTAWKRGGKTILRAGLVVCLAAGAWGGDRTALGGQDNIPRMLHQPTLEDAYASAGEQDPAPPTPPEFKPIPKTIKPPRADGSPMPATPPAAGCQTSCPPGDASCGSTCSRWLDTGECAEGCRWWSATAGAMVLHRSGTRDYIIGNGPFSSGQFDEQWSAGPRIEIARQYQKGALEFVYWGVENWNDELVSAHGTPRQEVAGYRSRLYNWEWNVKRKMEPITFLAGVRYMELQERMFTEEAVPPTSFDQREAANYLYGVQLGADADLGRFERFSLNAFVKAGVFANHIHEFAPNGDATHTETALVGETGLKAKVMLSRHMWVYGAYEVLWLDGVVLAPDMLGALAAGQTETNTPFYHGGNFGIEFCW